MFYKKDHKQLTMFDEWGHLGDKRRRLLEMSWAGLFREHLLHTLPVDRMSKCFSAFMGRPTKELYTVLGVLIFQQMFDLTDEEAISELSFNIQWHYALNIAEESDAFKYISAKTLWTFRKLVTDKGLDSILFDQIAQELARVFDVDLTKQRLDSVHIKSNMRNMGRIGLIAASVNKFLKSLKRHHKQEFKQLPEDIIERYLSRQAKQCFSLVKPSEARKKLKTVANDMYFLVKRYEKHAKVSKSYSYKLLCRILKEQCNLSDKGIELKRPAEVPSDSIQNPSDPDAGYCGHKGKGYNLQLMETFCESEDKEKRDKTLNLITHVEVEPANNSDTNALIPTIEASEKKGLKPKEVLADTPYGSDENVQKAKKKKVEIISPVKKGTPKEGYHLQDFNLSKKSRIINCPKGHKPILNNKKKRYSAAFDSKTCKTCPTLKNCPVEKGAKYYYFRYTKKDVRLAKRRIKEESADFKNRYRYRSGVEATFSESDRRTNIKNLRVRGIKAVIFCAKLKAVGINIFRATAALNARNSQIPPADKAKIAFYRPFSIFKELFGLLQKNLSSFWPQKLYLANYCSLNL